METKSLNGPLEFVIHGVAVTVVGVGDELAIIKCEVGVG